MIVANQLKEKNRAEYLLYMWQVEDIIRSFHCDIDRLRNEYLSRFKLDDATRRMMEEWYANLCVMMQSEGKMQKGHLQICQNAMQELTELNAQLLSSPKFPYYREMYYKILPYVVELRRKKKLSEQEANHNESQKEHDENENAEGEIETCFDLLYGVMLLRLQQKSVTAGTKQAVDDVTRFLGQLSDYYLKNKREPISFDD